jgi:hypothetical protein
MLGAAWPRKARLSAPGAAESTFDKNSAKNLDQEGRLVYKELKSERHNGNSG